MLDMEILDGADGLTLMIDFAASLYAEESMERFKDIYVKLAQALVTHNSQADVTIGEIKEKLRRNQGKAGRQEDLLQDDRRYFQQKEVRTDGSGKTERSKNRWIRKKNYHRNSRSGHC